MEHGRFFRKIVELRTANDKAPGLPFAEILSESRLRSQFDEFNNQAVTRDRVYTPCVTVWTFLSQVLSADQSCNAAVSRFLAYRIRSGQAPCSADNSSYCQARKRLPEALLARLVRDTGKEVQQQVPSTWLAHNRPVKFIDGSTVSMPDTPENVKEFGKPSNQKGQSGFPLARLVVVLCLATGVVLESAIGRYSGKQTGELSLFRSLKDPFTAGDILLGDRLFCSYCDIGRLRGQGVDVVFRLHAKRRADFRRGKRLGRDDHVVTWSKPTQCPDWLSAEDYEALPAELQMREVRVRVALPGFRVKSMVVVTTLTDPEQFSKEDIATLYRQRWHAELDLRSIKSVMQMDVLRCRTPSMVRKEIWAHFLAYNLLRSVMCAAADEHEIPVREVSFKGTLQLLNEFYHAIVTSTAEALQTQCTMLLNAVRRHRVGNRPNRYEPRKRKRPAKPYPPLKLSRETERKRCAQNRLR